jgi:hypothetical protein
MGVAVNEHARTYRLDYWLETDEGFGTSRLRAIVRGAGWRRRLDLRRQGDGTWRMATLVAGQVDLSPPGGDAASLSGAVDCDLGLSPLTNTLPVLRLDLHRRPGRHEILVAWVSVPDLGVRPYRQRYTGRGIDAAARPVVRYEDVDGDFAADLTLDGDGFVLHYPGLARRLGGAA